MAKNARKAALKQTSRKELKKTHVEEVSQEEIVDEEMTFCLGCFIELAESLEGREGKANKRTEKEIRTAC